MAYNALSLRSISKILFYQSFIKVFLLMMIRSISSAASFKVFLAAAVSSFCEISCA